MKKQLKFLLLTLCIGIQICLLQVHAQNQKPIVNNLSTLPKPIGYVNDFENILSHEQESKLNNLIGLIEKETLLEIAVVTIPAKYLLTTNISDYSLELAKNWRIGKKELNNGIMIAICKDSRLIRIQIGTGLEKIYTNEQVAEIIQENIKNAFIREGYYEGIFSAITRMTEELKPNLKKLISTGSK